MYIYWRIIYSIICLWDDISVGVTKLFRSFFIAKIITFIELNEKKLFLNYDYELYNGKKKLFKISTLNEMYY